MIEITFKDIALSWLMKDYFEKMPRQKHDKAYTAEVNILLPEFDYVCKTYTYGTWDVNTLAYRQARWKAFLHDWFNWCWAGGYGVEWCVSIQETESKF
jgi:hypothetical protein